MAAIDETVRQHKFILDETEMPTAWYNIVPDLPHLRPRPCTRARWSRPAPTTSPRCSRWTSSSRRSSTERYIDIPGGGARRLPAVAAVAAVPGPPAGAGARHPGPDLLQVRGSLPGRLAQAQHRRPPGVLQRQGRV